MTTFNLFTNRATAKLALPMSSGDTALTLVPGGGAWFPLPAANQYFRLVVQKGTGQTDQREYMLCTSRTGDVLTIERGLEGTPPAAFAVGDEASLVVTALSLNGLVQRVGPTLQGALEVEADPVAPLGIATKQFVESGRLADAPADGKDYARKDTAWHALGAAAGLAVPIPITAGGTGGATLPAAQTNLVIGVTSIDDLEPATKKYGDRWIKPSNMTELVWVPNQGTAGTGVWINPMDAQSEAYPIPVAKGGTGATTAAQARINLGGTTVGIGVFTAATAAAARTTLGATTVGDAVFIAATQAAGRTALGIVDYTTVAFKLFDGTYSAPGLAWNSEPGFGWFRPSASTVNIAAQGGIVYSLTAGVATSTVIGLWPRATGTASIGLASAPVGSANTSSINMRASASGYDIFEGLGGASAPQALMFTFPAGLRTNGDWTISKGGNPTYALNRLTAGTACDVTGSLNGVLRWMLRLGNGANSDEFTILRANDAGAVVGTIMGATRDTGLVTFYEPPGIQVNGPINCSGNIAGGNGMGLMFDGNAANRLAMGGGLSGIWCWQWNRANGDIQWQNNTAAVVFKIAGTGAIACGAIASSGSITGTIGGFSGNLTGGGQLLEDYGGWRNHWFGGIDWGIRWNTSSGLFQFTGPGQIYNMSVDGSGNLNVRTNGWKPGGGPWENNSSDLRTKDNVEDFTEGLEAILTLRPRTFNYKPETGFDSEVTHVGLVAQEAPKRLRKPAPKQAMSEMYDDLETVITNPIQYQLINAVKTLHARVRQLENRK